jgi:hypothetical protein
MYIKITHYGYFEKDGQQVCGLFCGHLPVGVTIEKELEILYPEENCILVNKITGEKYSAVYLKDADCEDNYIEKEIDNDANNTIN